MNYKNLYTDPKNIIILLLLIISIIFGFLWINSSNSDKRYYNELKDKIEKLKKDNEILIQNDSILKKKINNMEDQKLIYIKNIEESDKRIEKLNYNLEKKIKEVQGLKQKIDLNKKKIEEAKKENIESDKLEEELQNIWK